MPPARVLTRNGRPQASASPSRSRSIVGSIIGVGIFNLPTSLAGYGPITLVSMALTTVGALALALLFAALSRRLPADGGPYAYARVGVRQRPGLRQRVVVLDHRLGRQRRDRRRLGAVRRGVRQQGPQPSSVSVLLVLVGLWIPAVDQPVRREEHGLGPGHHDRPEVRRARVHVDRRALLHQRAPTTRRGTSAARARSRAIGGGMAIALFSYLGVEVAAVAAAKVRDPDRNIPRATIFGTLATAVVYMLSLTAVFGILPSSTAGRRRPRRSPTRSTRCSAARGPATSWRSSSSSPASGR